MRKNLPQKFMVEGGMSELLEKKRRELNHRHGVYLCRAKATYLRNANDIALIRQLKLGTGGGGELLL